MVAAHIAAQMRVELLMVAFSPGRGQSDHGEQHSSNDVTVYSDNHLTRKLLQAVLADWRKGKIECWINAQLVFGL